MTDRDALLAAVLANPADDTARLVYADCLQENGESERAEFIRVQVELSVLPPQVPIWTKSEHPLVTQIANVTRAATDPYLIRRTELRRRERELLDGHVKPALGEGRFTNRVLWFTGDLYDYTHFSPQLTRGFVSHITCSWSDWLAHADAIRACQPVERVKLTTAYREGEFEVNGKRFYMRTSDDFRTLVLEPLWPGIAFELPATRNYSSAGEMMGDILAAENL